jgi:uncharacterized protein (DUF4415 family)
MPIVRKTKADLKGFRLTGAQRKRLDTMTDAEITAAAKSDPDNPPITAAGFKRMRLGRPPLPAGERKKSVTLRIDPAVVAHFRSLGPGWQTRIGAVLSSHIKRSRLASSRPPRKSG